MNHEALWTYRRPLAYAVSYLLVLATSTRVVEYALVRAGADDTLDDHRDTGTVIGKLENVLVLTLIYAGAYTAIGLVFGAKSLLRIEDTDSGNATYYHGHTRELHVVDARRHGDVPAGGEPLRATRPGSSYSMWPSSRNWSASAFS